MTTAVQTEPTATERDRYLARVEIRILGPIEAVRDGNLLPLGGLRERALLALLALSRRFAFARGLTM